jgi:hypothetical protein
MAKLFLCYSRKDADRVSRLASALESAGHSVWIDEQGVVGGEQWRKSIVDAIESSERFILLLSVNSIISDNVRRELDLAEGADVLILPLDLDRVVIPPEMKYQLAGLQRINLYADIEEGIQSLLTLLGDETHEIETSRTTVQDERVATRRHRRNLVFGALYGFAVGVVYSVLNLIFLIGLQDPQRSFDDKVIMVSMPSLVYGICGSIIGAVIGRFWRLSRIFRTATAVGPAVVCFLGSLIGSHRWGKGPRPSHKQFYSVLTSPYR